MKRIGPQLSQTTPSDIMVNQIPTTDHYQRSYMHRGILTHLLCSSKLDLLITASMDGHLKFWRKTFHLVEFIKHFKAHSQPISSLSLSQNHNILASSSFDKSIKIFDLLNCDLSRLLKFDFKLAGCQFIKLDEDNRLAVLSVQSSSILIIDPFQEHYLSSSIQILVHQAPLKCIKHNFHLQITFSTDQQGKVQIWDPKTGDYPINPFLKYRYRCQTDLGKLPSMVPDSLVVSPKGKYLAVVYRNSVAVLNCRTGRLDFNYVQQTIQQQQIDIAKDLKDILQSVNAQFDQSQEFVLIPAITGVMLFKIKTKQIIALIGTKDQERFLKITLYQGKKMKNLSGASSMHTAKKESDPCLFCTSYKKNRFFIFSKREPEQSQGKLIRDIINEKPVKQDIVEKLQEHKARIPQTFEVQVQTTLGDFYIHLYAKECPRACQNFIKLAKQGYYQNLIFHRIIKGFIIQGGCPLGNGTGGQSCWGGYFEDQFHPKLKHDRGFTVSMANSGPNTNGSQFFITVCPAQWLDGKHTLFGKVNRGMDVIESLNRVKTDKNEMPFVPPKILKMIRM